MLAKWNIRINKQHKDKKSQSRCPQFRYAEYDLSLLASAASQNRARAKKKMMQTTRGR